MGFAAATTSDPFSINKNGGKPNIQPPPLPPNDPPAPSSVGTATSSSILGAGLRAVHGGCLKSAFVSSGMGVVGGSMCWNAS